MDFTKLTTEARSCRRFDESKRLNIEELNWLINCARVSPSARNAQVLRYIAVESEAVCAEIFPHTRWAGAIKWDGPMEGERPTAYIAILCPVKSNKLVHMDLGIAAQTIQLAAHTKGLGCCMHVSFTVKSCTEILQVPEDMEIGILLTLGVAKEKRSLAPMPADGNFAYWRDDVQTHFVPKRSLEEVLLRKH